MQIYQKNKWALRKQKEAGEAAAAAATAAAGQHSDKPAAVTAA